MTKYGGRAWTDTPASQCALVCSRAPTHARADNSLHAVCMHMCMQVCGRRHSASACSGRRLEHEREHAVQNRADGPRWNPRLRVEVRHREAEPLVRLEAAVGRDHVDGGRLEREVVGETNLAVVQPALVR
eukprot:6174869-Pleurochrysis_carterae.AAC.3